MCRRCYKELVAQIKFSNRTVRGILIHSIWEWEQNKTPIISSLSNSLKQRPDTFFGLKDQLYQQLYEHLPSTLEHKNYLILWIPSKEPRQSNHSFLLAKHLSYKLTAPLISDPETQNPSKQKSKKQRERWETKWRVSKGFKSEIQYLANQNPSLTFLFVDDIITTGATLYTLSHSLGLPKERIEAFAPIYRKLATS